MTIMVAGGLTFAVPGVMPVAHAANANLFVSAENSKFDNYMSGPQVIEVIVIDSNIDENDDSEPGVTVNGKELRMVQATDGSWYGYFADRKQAITADKTVVENAAGYGLDYGTFCSSASNIGSTGNTVTASETVGIAIPSGEGKDGYELKLDEPISDACSSPFDTNNTQNVLREEKSINRSNSAGGGAGGINLDSAVWPFIQLYDLNPTGNVVIQYNKGGGTQSTTLTFDTVDGFAGLELDRRVYTQSSEVHVTVTDVWLNIDPTDEDSWTFGTGDTPSTNYQVFDENGGPAGAANENGTIDISDSLSDLMAGINGVLLINTNTQGSTESVLTLQDNDDSAITCTDNQNASSCRIVPDNSAHLSANSQPVTLTEQGPNTGIFGTYDESDTSVLKITDNAKRGTSATIDYNESPVTVLVGFDFGTINIAPEDDEWNSGESIPIVITDADMNKNSRVDEDLTVDRHDVLVPALTTGDPFTLGEAEYATYNVAYIPADGQAVDGVFSENITASATMKVTLFSEIGVIDRHNTINNDYNALVVDLKTNIQELRDTIVQETTVSNLLNYDVRSLDQDITHIVLLVNNATNSSSIVTNMNVQYTDKQQLVHDDGGLNTQDLVLLNDAALNFIFDPANDGSKIALKYVFSSSLDATSDGFDDTKTIVTDFFSFGFTDDGAQSSERIANQIIRIEVEESGDNTGTFEGSLEYVMVNQINIQDENTFAGITTIADDPSFIVIEDLTDEDAPRVSYNDLGADGVATPISDQEAAPSHSGVVSLNQESYKIADTVVITLEDQDLNVDSDLIDIFTVVRAFGDVDNDQVGIDASGALETLSFGSMGRLLDVTFDDTKWEGYGAGKCNAAYDDGLGATGFTLVETGVASGTFIGDFQIPLDWCRSADSKPESVTGLDIEVNYVDFRDASGEITEVGDSAGVRANTGSVSLDRTVYPVPFGVPGDFAPSDSGSPSDRSIFPVHETGIGGKIDNGEFLANGDLSVHIRVNDPDFNINPTGEDSIESDIADGVVGPVKISVLRGSSSVVLGYAGGVTTNTDGLIGVGDVNDNIRQFGSINEIAPDAGIYEYDLTVRHTDGPASTTCPDTSQANKHFNVQPSIGENYCILQGDILQVEYTDPTDASGDVNTVTDSATFDLRNGVLQSDKSVYIIGSDMILTLIEPDLDLDNDGAETYDLDLIEWDSDAATVTMGNLGNNAAVFDPEPLDLRETGDSTGIFQIVIEIPEIIEGDSLERGEQIDLEYTDWGPSGSDYVGDEEEDVSLTVFTSNFGATIELDQKVYTWTDKVYITIVAPDHNFDSDLVDEIGNTRNDPIKVATGEDDIDGYKLVETGTDTGIFTGEVILIGFPHDADGDSTTGDNNGNDIVARPADGTGPTDGLLPVEDEDGISVSFEFSEDETVIGSAIVRWNIGETQWLEASYPASGTGIVRVIDPDMNLDPEAVDNFDIDVKSEYDKAGIDLTVTETNEATGIFEGTVFFTTTEDSSGHRLRVAEGDTITAEYEDNTLPDPYKTGDELDITATSIIGTLVPPLERVITTNLRVVDAFENSLDSVSVDQQVQINADLANGQDKMQPFAYLVQVQDDNGVTVSLVWIKGSLSAGQSLSPASSWIPTEAGSYTATAFVWESVNNPTALSPPVSTTVNVS